MYLTTLIQNQRCMIQRWFGISAVSDNADISFQRYVFTFEAISAVGYSADFTFEYEYLREFETEFENIVECESVAHMGSIYGKKQ